ncbi:DnaJ -like protein [Babesia sp. Xinjiang]|uniref:DnaJ -like protein n=1 Tax=Babesia sp. Xinjiang TaxID=462227 RepID=UPI000A2544EE|nr:DnaJ -like protein [Babesia sp. Xinjiang]ORM39430.1 DnaJ -like protein [Babesia sp. Xinjiang]
MFFGDFGFGGMPGGMPHHRSREVDNEKFYKTLELSRDCSESEIKKAYRKLAIKHHPDKGGDPEKFKEISRAYEVLSDPEKRRIYDEHGEEGVDGNFSHGDASDIFDLFFGGGRKSKGKKRGEDVVTQLKVTLEQMYNGAMRKLAINKDVVCESCDGLGGPSDAFVNCDLCNGRGIRVQIRQMGAMIQQSQCMCNACNGQGRTISDSKRCKSCSGRGVMQTKKILEVSIERGVPDQHRVTFHGEADERPNEIPGNVVFIICQAPHEQFKRSGADLIMLKTIQLYEALTGCTFYVKHLDGRILAVQTPENEIVRPGSVFVIENEGMPVFKSAFGKGNLYVTFEVQFPISRKFSAVEKERLLELFPYKPEQPPSGVSTIVNVGASEVDPEEIQERARVHAHVEHDRDDEPEGNRVQCKQQ